MAANLKVLLVGGGGREHALAWKLADSPLVSHVFCAPGNAGTAREPFVTNIEDLNDAEDPQSILALTRRLGADLTVIGPEAPLAAGVVDLFEAEGLAIFGPTRAAARLEWSKGFAKDFMARRGIPTARYAVAETSAQAAAAIRRFGAPVVVKADGLAAGKGVTVAPDRLTAEKAVHEAMDLGAFGASGRRLVIEECLEGPEVSVLAFTDGEAVAAFPPAQDHKRAYNGDQGPNTGGMGAYCPARILDAAGEQAVMEKVLLPTVRGMGEEGAPLRGVLYAGLMLTSEGPKVLEYNCRFGDPETQVLMPLLEDDLAELMVAVSHAGARQSNAGAAGRRQVTAGRREVAPTLSGRKLTIADEACACVVMASGGYPGSYEKGKAIDGLEIADLRPRVKVFHAGTKVSGRRTLTSGGRVLGVTATASSLEDAVEEAYKAAALIHFEGEHFRTDIAGKAIKGE